ncbi:putative beta-glucosidase I [Psilocybe cubensis]|uniref:Beta-glucosidase I n=1 Tax=Psilocybe cubensis TaxID=181762 RepID=A0ACB8H8C5_PSICU|nr:putative beta-glucosidase I [Psilocybe cubensis]KAH9483439.1 putative beta-glucosidase I [Psilocybe cubensis]
MPPSDFAKASIPDVLAKLTTEEAILLTAGVGFWHTHALERLGVPAIKVSDGPNGLRGNHFFRGTPAKCLPSSTALGATFDPELIHEVGKKLLAEEAKLRAASLILAPTCNIQRNPLGGRSFESFSEDPFLSGHIAAAYINGVQSGGIGATIKHFVGNDKENDRNGYDSIISPRALREIYLMPFMLAQKHAQPWAYMTAYNRVNGIHVSEDNFLLKKVLREEWKYDGLIMSDWHVLFYSVSDSLNAGLDLEMPGTNKWRTINLVSRSIDARKVTTRTVKERARRVLEAVKKCAAGAPEILDGDGIEHTVDTQESKDLLRSVAAQSIVLLKNEGSILPIRLPKTESKKAKVAVIGPNAKAIVLSGGGSAALKASFFVSPFEGISRALKEEGKKDGLEVEVTYSEGSRAYKTMPSLDYDIFTPSGERGWIASWHAHLNDESMVAKEEVYEEMLLDETRVFVSIDKPKGITERWTVKLRGQLKPREKDCLFEFGLTVAGRAKLFVDGKLIIDNWTRQVRGEDFFGCASIEEKGTFEAKAGVKHDILVEFCNVRSPADGDEDEMLMDSNPGVRLGGAPVEDPDELMATAVQLAKEADIVIAVVGLNSDWETEGYDRTTLALPGRTDELVSKLAEANPKTVVVTQSGSAITMPWAESVAGHIHAWYLGNASGDAIADVLLGRHNPSAKLSLTFPKNENDVPSYGHFHSEDGKIRYSEDLYVPSIADSEFSLTVSLNVTNTGNVTGSEVIQVYIAAPTTSELTHPLLQLKGFAKAKNLAPGESRKVDIVLDKYAVSYWSELYDTWTVEQGVWGIKVGTASDKLVLEDSFKIEKGFEWNGL